MSRSARRAFTLIELLVVVAILTLLLSILAPSLRLARAEAIRAVCLTTLRRHTVALVQYANGHNRHYPLMHPHPFANNPYSFPASVHDVLNDEFGLDEAAWVCPAFPAELRAANGGGWGKTYYDRAIPRYVAGYLVLVGGNGYPTWKSLSAGQPYNGNMATSPLRQRVSVTVLPDQVVMVQDYLLDGHYGTWAPHGVGGRFLRLPGPASGAPPSAPLAEVCERGNQVFEDGHATASPVGPDGIESYSAGWGYYFHW